MPDTTILTDEQVAETEARANAATEGPWVCRESTMWAHPFDDSKGKVPSGGIEGPDYIPDPECNGFRLHDARFIAHARTDIPALCQTVRALRAQLDQVSKERQEWLGWADNLTGNQHYLASKMRRDIAKRSR